MAQEVVERMRAATPMSQRCSAGLAQWDGSETAQELIRRADEALYRAKRSGRDQTVVAESAPAPAVLPPAPGQATGPFPAPAPAD